MTSHLMTAWWDVGWLEERNHAFNGLGLPGADGMLHVCGILHMAGGQIASALAACLGGLCTWWALDSACQPCSMSKRPTSKLNVHHRQKPLGASDAPLPWWRTRLTSEALSPPI